MAACSALELEAASQALTWIEEPAKDTDDLFDEGYEYIRHIILEAWVDTKESDRAMLAPCLDLLTSLKFRAEVPVKTAVPAGGFSGFRTCLEERPQHVRVLQDRAMWLGLLSRSGEPPGGASSTCSAWSTWLLRTGSKYGALECEFGLSGCTCPCLFSCCTCCAARLNGGRVVGCSPLPGQFAVCSGFRPMPCFLHSGGFASS